MIQFAGLEQAIAVAERAHRNQLDKMGRPYICHCLRIATRFPDERRRMVAFLHDVVEKGEGWTLRRLAAEGFPADVILAVDALTRRDGEQERAFIERSLADPLAATVKLADLRDNFNASLRGTGEAEKYRARMELIEEIVCWSKIDR